MLSIYDDSSAKTVLDQPLNPELVALITDRLHDAESLGLGQMTHLVVIEPTDTEAAVYQELGWSPLTNPIDKARFGTAEFVPFWSWLQDLGGWYELILTVGNEGFAYILLIEKQERSPNDLQALCRHYAEEAKVCG
ncbi:hypothetical protein [Altererythrobacter sp. Root672]|uniref:hypothetical protein n=1 Tax=Altererythrobacter sp. Root672 TaxID=1736584 RepID=UPI0006F8C0BA|nr:hypothetical protein [Altererythrobacter sp. Root672]KRA82550.1 hypothetical protein ASD76_00075 [Altererythrobacter sp. Root672]